MSSSGSDRWAVALGAGTGPAAAVRALARLPAGLALARPTGTELVLIFGAVREGRPPSLFGTVADTIVDASVAPTANARWMTAGERDAYRAGRAAALAGVRRALT